MKQLEHELWGLIKDKLIGDVSRIENAADSGTPDVSAAYEKDYWVELKATESIKEIDVTTLLRPAQIVWHKRRAKQGTIIFVMVRYSHDGIVIYQYVYDKNEYVKLACIEKDNHRHYDWNKFQETLKFAILTA
jgi:hypothetical protein